MTSKYITLFLIKLTPHKKKYVCSTFNFHIMNFLRVFNENGIHRFVFLCMYRLGLYVYNKIDPIPFDIELSALPE